MRDFLDAILDFINAESLTDDEFTALSTDLVQAYSKEVYLALRGVLEARENVSDACKRLKLYFVAKGVDISDTPAVPTPNSNIFLGSGL